MCTAAQAPAGTWPHRSKYLIDRIDISVKNQNDAWVVQKRYQLKYNYRTSAGSLVQMSRDDVDARGGMSMWLGRPDVHRVDPFVTTVEPVRSQRLLLCTDGLYRTVGAELLQELMCAESTVTPRQVVHTLISAAEGSVDDATAIVIETACWRTPSEPAAFPVGAVDHPPRMPAAHPRALVPSQTPPPQVGSPDPETERPKRRWATWLRGPEGPSEE